MKLSFLVSKESMKHNDTIEHIPMKSLFSRP